MSEAEVLVVEDDAALREALCDTLTLAGYTVQAVDGGAAALAYLAEGSARLVISDVQMRPMDGHALLRRIKTEYTELPVILMTAFGTVPQAVAAMRDGAVDYLVKPFEAEALVAMVARYMPAYYPEDDELVADDAVTREVVDMARRVAASEATVLLTGESGTGKEVFARFIHRHSPRAQGPFVAINCAAIPEHMLEAVLFGYERGAFTGAHQATPGKFEQAQGGTLLLDEISEMSLALQAKLLRVLQEREVERLGARKPITLDVRVLATSNRNLRAEVAANKFREDLYYRLHVFPLKLPALRERRADIVPLARRLLERHRGRRGITPTLSTAAQQKLCTYPWPGNVRELDNVMQRALILKSGDEIDACDLCLEIPGEAFETAVASPLGAGLLGEEIRSHEQQLILDALRNAKGNRKEVAERLGISPRTLRYKLAQLRDAGVAV